MPDPQAQPPSRVFERLCAILRPYANRLVVTTDTDAVLSLDTAHRMKNQRPLFFGAVHARKAGVSFHLMPVYVRPALLDSLSPALRRRMQGKSCFNFKTVDEALLAELEALTAAGFASYQEQGYV